MPRDIDYEHEPKASGEVTIIGDKQDFFNGKAARMQQDVEVHGECHATFENIDKEVEVRLRTAVFNYDDGVIEIWDGDTHVPFSMDKLVSWYQPMDVYHE